METLGKIWELINHPIFKLGEKDINIVALATAVIILMAGFKLASLAEEAVGRLLERRNVEAGLRGSIERFTRYLCIILGFFVACFSPPCYLKTSAIHR